MSPRRRGRPAPERLRHLLVILPWLMERESTSVVEAAARFGLGVDELVEDLELASLCGLPPYVDELLDVFIDDGMIHVGVPRLFTRPLRLNAIEAFELVLAGRAAMELPGADPDGPLGRGLAKLERWLDAELGAESVETGTDGGGSGSMSGASDDGVETGVAIDLDRPARVDELVAAVRRVEELVMRYRSVAGDVLTERRVVPRQVFTDRGRWYLLADDERSGERRTFRIDRIIDVTATGRFHDPDETPLPTPGAWFVDGELDRVRLVLQPPARWVVERYPSHEVSQREDGSFDVVLPVTGRSWLERLLVRLGPDAGVVEPVSLAAVGAEAAARLLGRYDDT